ncbi:Protein CBG22939 [Caenorhabditis briggsae]|uniref:Protein CBG22939 n=1 Tax=Caenorhabditis briggsae TaxID=6238 RepID=A8Y3M0_CAEBR|nr:Protein CBG22939 [Caenorhabditis briggsae]CAP39489.2 Protein CBG22939 [Caenorhabditis briggsae]
MGAQENYTGNSASSEFSTTTTPSGSPTSSESTSPQTPPTLATPPPQPPFSDIHCFIDDKLRKEVELFHVIGVRNHDSKMLISGPGENFRFLFFHETTVTQKTSEPVTPSTVGTTVTHNATVTPPDSTVGSTVGSTVTSTSESTTVTQESTVIPSTVTQDLWNSTTSDTVVLNSTTIPIVWPTLGTTTKAGPQNFNTPLEQLFTNNVTVAWDESLQKFHFMVPDKAFRHYQITYKTYQSLTDHEDRSLRFRNLKTPEMVSKNLTEPYTCHYNVRNNNSICVSIHDQLVTVGSYSKNEQDNREKRFVLPNFLSFDKFFSYSDSQGIDYILIHHRGQWIYRINLQMYFLDQNMFFKVFQLITPDGAYAFVDFEHADEFGLVTKYAFDDNHYRYYYSLFSENSGLNTYCVHDKKINGRLMILGREKIEQVKSPMEALRMKLNVAKGDEYEFPTMLRLLFYCSLTYLSIFIATQMIPNRRPLIFKELRHTDREIQRLAPVIETIMGRVHEFLESTKSQKTSKKAK